MDWSTLWLSKDLNTPLYLASMGLIFFSIGGILANLFSNSLIDLFTEKVVGCHFVMIGASIMLLSLLTNNFYIILGVLCIYGFAIANLVPIVIRQAVKQSNESIPMTVTNLITIGLSSTMIMPAAIGFLAETFSLTLNMYLLSIIVFTSGFVFLIKFK
jgi:MFS family permease